MITQTHAYTLLANRLKKAFICLILLIPGTVYATVLPGCFSGPLTYNINYDRELTPSENKAGTMFAIDFLSGSDNVAEANCQCPKTGFYYDTVVGEVTAAASPLPAGGTNRGKLTDRLDVIVKGTTDAVNGTGSLTFIPITLYPTPTDKMSSKNDIKLAENNQDVCSQTTHPSKGATVKRQFKWNTVSLNFYITKPIFGKEVISPVTVVQYYSCLYYDSSCKVTETQHVSDIILSGVISAPLTCTINAGSTIEAELGTVTTPQFVTKGHIPSGYRLTDVDISYHCDNDDARSSTDKIVISLTSDQGVVEDSNKLIAKMIGRDDIGVRMFDENDNNVVLDGSVSFPLTLDQDGNGQVKMKAAPVSTTDTPPAAGPFEGNVTVKMDIK